MSRHAPVTCFLVVATDRHRVKLRRWSEGASRPCPARGSWGHEAGAVVGEVRDPGHPANGDDPERFPHDDPRWPSACEHCGAPFEAADAWQVFHEGVYARTDGAPGEYFLRSLPAGAMYDATWLDHQRGPDGRSLMLMLPDGRLWHVDGPSTNGDGWTRTGDAPRITARPSILTHGADGRESYHGWLTDGVLTPC